MSVRPSLKIVIRAARHSDIAPVARLLSTLAGKKLTTRGAANRLAFIAANPDEKIVVACAGTTIVGLMAFRIRHNVESVSHYGEISAIVVDNAWRRKGVASILVRHAEVLARRRKCIGLWLVSGFKREKRAHRFYHSVGFTPTGVRFVKKFRS